MNEKKLFALPREIFSSKKLIGTLAKNDFKTKYAGSYLGVIWAFVQPIITVLVYWFVFEKGLNAAGVVTKQGIDVPFVLWLIAGLVPWFFFSDAINAGTNAFVEYSYLVKKVVFKIGIIPVVKTASAFFVHAFFIVFSVGLFWIYGFTPDLYTLQVLYYTFAMACLVFGVIYITSACTVFFRDVTQIVNIILQVGIWVTPIMWNIDTMGTRIPTVFLYILKANPMYYIVQGYRDCFINKTWFFERPELTILFWVITLCFLFGGGAVFKKLKVHFADVL